MNIDTSYILSGSIVGFICFVCTLGALFLAKIRYNAPGEVTHSFIGSFKFAISKRALMGAAVMPVLSMVLFYAFVVHLRFSVGHWPHFGESLPNQMLALHMEVVKYFALGLFCSLYATGVMTLIGFAFKSLRWLSFSCLLHMVFLAFSFGSFSLAPHPFLNWFFD